MAPQVPDYIVKDLFSVEMADLFIVNFFGELSNQIYRFSSDAKFFVSAPACA